MARCCGISGADPGRAGNAGMSPQLRRALGTADLVITKGQANDDVFSAYRAQDAGQVFGLFTIKCEPTAGVAASPRLKPHGKCGIRACVKVFAASIFPTEHCHGR